MENFNQVLIDCVKAAGGSVKVGPKMWPELLADAAQRKLLDCLNEDRPAKLSPDQVMLIMRLARDKGHHCGVSYILETLGYAPTVPVSPRDEADDLMRQLLEGQRTMAAQMARLTAIAPGITALRGATA